MGRFMLGSTVVLLFPKSGLRVQPGLAAGRHGPPRRADGRPAPDQYFSQVPLTLLWATPGLL